MKKLYFIALIVLSLITVGMFPLDIFVVTVPEFVIYALIAAVIACTVLVFAVSGTKGVTKALSAVIAVIITVTALAGVWIDPYFNSLSFRTSDYEYTLPYDTVIPADKACADIDYAMKYLQKNHPALMNGLTDDLRKRYESAISEIKSAGSVKVYELTRIAEGIFTLLGDAHTSVYANYSVPLYLKHYHRWDTEGYSICAINGVRISELLERSRELYSYEADSWLLHCMKNDLVRLQGLAYLGFNVEAGITFTFSDSDGDEKSETYYPGDFVSYHDYCVFNDLDIAQQAPVFVRYTIDEERSLALLTLDRCIYNSVYINCLHDMFTEVKNKGIKNVAVDLRGNGGGNSLVADEFIKYLDVNSFGVTTETMRLGPFLTPMGIGTVVNERYTDLTFTGDVYLLTSAGSFSSAMLFPQYIKDNGLGKLIGEPPGNDPNGYGEITEFRTPNAGMWISVSTKRFNRIDRECPDKYVMPDIPCDENSALDVLYETING